MPYIPASKALRILGGERLDLPLLDHMLSQNRKLLLIASSCSPRSDAVASVARGGMEVAFFDVAG
jgi:hypothetical protein